MLHNLSQKVAPKFECNKCNYKCSKKTDYKKHCLTKKHNAIFCGDNATSNVFTCHCGNVYKHSSSYYRHNKDCQIYLSESSNNGTDNTTQQQVNMTLVIELLKQNQEFKDLMIEQTKQLTEQQQYNQMMFEQQKQQNQMLIEHHQQQNNKLLDAVKDGKIGNTTIHNTNNNKFNLNFFLNETCKDAITMSDFINSIEVTMEDFIETGNIGFVDGISKVMVDRIKVMDLHTRPMHCTDLKRETLYIKNDERWEKEDNDKTLLRRAVKNIANKNYNQLNKWYNNSKPAVEMIGSDDCEKYFKYYKAALGGCDKEEDKKFEEKIIKNVLKEVLLDKVPT